MPSFRLLLVDDHALFREGLGLVLRQNFPNVEIIDALSVAQAANLGGVGERGAAGADRDR